jgi:hypothetical protein
LREKKKRKRRLKSWLKKQKKLKTEEQTKIVLCRGIFIWLFANTYILTNYTTTSANNDKNTDDYDSDVLRDELFI